MIYLTLFLSFLKIGAFTFGGGYAMISLIRETVLLHGWMEEAQILDFIAVAESTPGPVAVNMATYIGSSQGGILGAMCATLGVVLPSFIIILIVVTIMKNLIKYKGVQAFLSGVRPCVVALIVGTGIILGLNVLFGIKSGSTFSLNWRGLIIFCVVVAFSLIWKHFKKKKPSPILLIILSAVMGAIIF